MATLSKGKTFTNGELVTPQKIHELVDLGTVSNIVNADIAAGAGIALSKLATGALPTGITVASANIVDGTIVNADISASAAIADTKLATISTAGKVANSATTATNASTANAIVSRDASGNFSAGTITAGLSGNASTASKLATARTLSLTGDVTGSVSFDGSANASIAAVIADDSHNHIIANVDGLQTALDGKQAAGSYAPATGIAPSAITGTAVITTDSRLSNARTPTAHTHDDRYYTETEVNTLLAGKQAAGSYAAASHTHDDRYYTEAEVDAKLSGLPVSGHTHAATDITSGTLSISRIPTGTTATTVCIGNDSRLSNARTPTSHTHSAADITSGTLSNARTTATSANTASAIVARNASGDFNAGTITAALAGNASTATKLATARTISLTGDVTGSVSFDGSANASISAVIADDSHNHIIANIDGLQTALDGKQAAGSYAAASHTHSAADITSGTLSISRIPTGTTATTVCIGNDSRLSDARTPTFHTHSADQITSGNLSNDRLFATSANAVNNLVLRDASGNFSAGTITAALSGNAATATKLATARTISLTGDVTGSVSFDGSANASISAVIADDSHNHIIANVDGLQTALDGKVTNAGSVTAIQRVTAMPASPNATTLYIVIP